MPPETKSPTPPVTPLSEHRRQGKDAVAAQKNGATATTPPAETRRPLHRRQLRQPPAKNGGPRHKLIQIMLEDHSGISGRACEGSHGRATFARILGEGYAREGVERRNPCRPRSARLIRSRRQFWRPTRGCWSSCSSAITTSGSPLRNRSSCLWLRRRMRRFSVRQEAWGRRLRLRRRPKSSRLPRRRWPRHASSHTSWARCKTAYPSLGLAA
jgi:hypothetical protein